MISRRPGLDNFPFPMPGESTSLSLPIQISLTKMRPHCNIAYIFLPSFVTESAAAIVLPPPVHTSRLSMAALCWLCVLVVAHRAIVSAGTAASCSSAGTVPSLGGGHDAQNVFAAVFRCQVVSNTACGMWRIFGRTLKLHCASLQLPDDAEPDQ